MKLATDITTITYKDGDYIIDIVLNARLCMYESWLHHKDYGVKKYMFGVVFESSTFDEMVMMVESNLTMYIKAYEREVIRP